MNCKEIEDSYIIGKTSDHFQKKLRSQRNILGKDGHNKGQNGMDLSGVEEIKKRWQEYTEKLYKKIIPDNHDGVIADLKPDILECKVKWTLGSITNIKASRDERYSR